MGCGIAQPTSQPQRTSQPKTNSPQELLPQNIQNQQLLRIEQLSPQIFSHHDPGNGRLGMQEFYAAMQELYSELNNPPPREQLVWAKQQEHDKDGKGWIDQQTFTEIVKEVAGYKGRFAEKEQEQQQQQQQQQPSSQIIIQQQQVYIPPQPLSQPFPQAPPPIMIPMGPPSMPMGPPSMPMGPPIMPMGPPIMPMGPPIMPMGPPSMPMPMGPPMGPPMIQQQPPIVQAMQPQYPPIYQQQPPPYY